MFEAFCCGELAAKNEGVETAFVDNGQLLCSAKGVAFCDILILIVNVLENCISGIAVSESLCYICSYEPRFTVNVHCFDFTEFGIFVNFVFHVDILQFYLSVLVRTVLFVSYTVCIGCLCVFTRAI
jgi:hypothetical protein